MARSETPTLSEQNRLFFYELLRRQIGLDRQVFLPRIEEVLVAENLTGEDLGFSSTRELMKALGDMVNLTVFKGGRVYVRIPTRPSWDAILDAEKTTKPTKPQRRRRQARALKPQRPRRVKPKEPSSTEPKAHVASQTLSSERAAHPQSAGVSSAQTTAQNKALEQASDAQSAAVPRAHAESTLQDEAAVDTQCSPHTPEAADTQTPTMRTTVAGTEPASGSQAMPDAQIEPAEEAAMQSSSRIKADAGSHVALHTQVAGTEPASGSQAMPDAQIEPAEEAAMQPSSSIKVAASSHVALHTQITSLPQSTSGVQTAAHVQTESTAPPQLRITASPQEQVQPRVQHDDAACPDTPPSERALAEYPRDFSSEVYIPEALLARLMGLTLTGTDVLALLTDDFRIARGLALITGTRNRARFPLRFASTAGTPLTVTISKTTGAANTGGWMLEEIQGNEAYLRTA
ncbi:hypothetical protein K6V98_00695 [Collinsella sp. AGMB00827]|uniref:HTH OST-type domain-containing protein n=1 Tax=Collinsella ureilytica TaxID=2869515 RepID=A0ABS7MIG5_9ACTN|nr:hypothetical protein [Collinsella urealyticum]MBY4796885.1 hypothetical protein [Collinsella urealyticum]